MAAYRGKKNMNGWFVLYKGGMLVSASGWLSGMRGRSPAYTLFHFPRSGHLHTLGRSNIFTERRRKECLALDIIETYFLHFG